MKAEDINNYWNKVMLANYQKNIGLVAKEHQPFVQARIDYLKKVIY